MMVEDHPYDYAHFEGTIPKGNYRAGTVMVWDIGTWENLGPEPHEGLRSGKLHFKLNSKKLKGEWALVKMHCPRATKGNEWLLLKHGKAMKSISAKLDNTSAILDVPWLKSPAMQQTEFCGTLQAFYLKRFPLKG